MRPPRIAAGVALLALALGAAAQAPQPAPTSQAAGAVRHNLAGEWRGWTGIAVTNPGFPVAGRQVVTVQQQVVPYVLWLLPDGTYAEDPARLREGQQRPHYLVIDGGRTLVLFSPVPRTRPRTWPLHGGVPVTDIGPMQRK